MDIDVSLTFKVHMESTINPEFAGRVSWKTNIERIATKFTSMNLTKMFSGTIIHQMLLRKCSSNSMEMKFLVNGEKLYFGMKEFALVIGLNFGRFPTDETIFNQVEECSPLGDAWKLGLVYLVCQYLIALDPNRIINITLLSMVEDIDTFLNFPWEKLSFRETIKGLNKNLGHYRLLYLDKKKALGKKNKDKNVDISYTVNGFALALQVWIYEDGLVEEKNNDGIVEEVDVLDEKSNDRIVEKNNDGIVEEADVLDEKFNYGINCGEED
ncbi:uncharacterized protein LOC124924930 [Impatiens glandulifera]|uniref:uncharacterized protein LOC124924930 n=1 Tax=Impatiens glandulifera TaxID=253017 RepID=UPI001FB194D7|nr:uncharacterized protein LOC124924930 [Impatiens glandulifera]